MIWAMGALVVILLLLVATGNLRLMLGFLVVAVVIVTALLVFDRFVDQRSASRIPPEQVELIGFSLKPGHRTVYELAGRVQNHSPDFGLFRLSLRVLGLDCPQADAVKEDCLAISDQLTQLGVDVPAGQARDVEQRIRIDNAPLKPRGVLRWEFEVVSTAGG
ncbi:hypothetical protein [Litorivivens sp.]|uniref:hypothetical protein n=1 Tax=Litorivivens sp. TaxID=2020868 RepID=UPI0035672F04